MKNIICTTIAFLLLNAVNTSAQDFGEWEWFGSLQTFLFTQSSNGYANIRLPGYEYLSGTREGERSTFGLQQMDLFINKPIDDNFNVFIDMEFKMSYSSEKNWGAFSIQEAWLNYTHTPAFNIKAGMLYPAFNHLNEIKNRLALLPYIFRPIVYERLLSERFSNDDLVPDKAYLQIHGVIPVKHMYIDYAVYMGNSESGYISERRESGEIESWMDPDFEFISGADPTNFKEKLYGIRVGVRKFDEALKMGISATHDYANLRDSTRLPDLFDLENTFDSLRGSAPRFRLGADFSVHYLGFTLETEIIKVLYQYDRADELGITLEQDFVYGMLGYNITPELFVFIMGSWSKYQFDSTNRFRTREAGLAYNINNSIMLKAQYTRYHEEQKLWYGEADTDIDFVFIGCSVLL
jgi:hypothetical protein